MSDANYAGLTQLGDHVEQPLSPDVAKLERVANPSRGKNFVIDYIPCDWIVESKSLKLYLTSFRNHGAFHEACTMAITERLMALLDPIWLRIGAYWYPRGGMPIDVFWQSGAAPQDAWIPAQDVAPYRGRG
jgi:7-cyano-7-deazaguanine reductase